MDSSKAGGVLEIVKSSEDLRFPRPVTKERGEGQGEGQALIVHADAVATTDVII
jgi:hypothetical protein